MATITACNGIVECGPKYNVLIDNSFHFYARYCCEGEECIDPCKFFDSPASPDLSSCNLKPCVKIRWGDSPNDQLETDDVEIMCLEFSNCFKLISFEEICVTKIVVTPNNTLPDDTPSVMIVPSQKICFGNLRPCKGKKDTASREIVLITRGAQAGNYTIRVMFEYKVCGTVCKGMADFKITLVSS